MSLLLLLVASTPSAHATGTADLDGAVLAQSTVLFADVIDPLVETIDWTGDSSVLIVDPDGLFVTILASGSSLVPTKSGAYSLSLLGDQTSFDLSVTGAAGGRVWSEQWDLSTAGFDSPGSIDLTVYALATEGGGDAVVEWRTEGLAGTIVQVGANATGLDPRAWSVPDEGQVIDQPWPLYLQPPELATGVAPVGVLFYTDYLPSNDDCDNLETEGVFSFVSSIGGTYHIICDTDGDAVFDPMNPDDVHIVGQAVAGFNPVEWNGDTAGGTDVPDGTYDCQVVLAPLEVHSLLFDAETGFSGVRQFRSDPGVPATSLPMFFQDQLLIASSMNLPNGDPPLHVSPPTGLDAGDPLAAPTPNVDSRAWGAFTTSGKGDRAFLDTWTWIDPVTSPTFQIEVTSLLDSDADGLPDLEEECELCTDPNNPDTDGDTLFDGLEVGISTDPCNVDTDADSIPDDYEVVDPLDPVDTDGDGAIDAIDPDDDDDTVPTIDEAYGAITDPRDQDSDGDTKPDYLDRDDDGDGLLTSPTEDIDNNGDPRNDDTDGDGIPNYLDPDLPPPDTSDTGTVTTTGDTGTPTDTSDTDDTGAPTPTGDTGDTDTETGDTGNVIIVTPTGATGDTGDTDTGEPDPETGDTSDTDPGPETGDTGDTDPDPETGDTADTDPDPETGDTADTDTDTGDTGDIVIVLPTGATGDTAETGDSPLPTGDTGDLETGETGDSPLPTGHTGLVETGEPQPTGDTGTTPPLTTGDTGTAGETGDTADGLKVDEYYEGGCSGCGTSSSTGPAFLPLMLLLAIGIRRR